MAVEIGSTLGQRFIGSRISSLDQSAFTPKATPKFRYSENVVTLYPGNITATGAYLMLNFKEYVRPNVLEANSFKSVGTIILPLPADLQDHIELNYSEEALGPTAGLAVNAGRPKEIQQKHSSYGAVEAALGLAAWAFNGLTSALTLGTNLGSNTSATGVLQAARAYAANPYLTVLFKSPKFKRFHMTWIFIPENAKDTDTLNFVFNKLRYHSLPTLDSFAGSALYGYPDVVKPRVFPEGYQFDFKHCVVESATLDYVPGDTPAFQARTRAPVAYKLTLDLLEMELWTREDIVSADYRN